MCDVGPPSFLRKINNNLTADAARKLLISSMAVVVVEVLHQHRSGAMAESRSGTTFDILWIMH